MLFPTLSAERQQTLATERFLGYDHNLELADGEFYDMENLSADHYPLLSPRPRRGTAQALSGVQGILAKDALCWVRNNTLYINGASMEAYMPSVNLKAGEKQLVSMGAYLCIFPDGIYFNTEDYSDNGYMGHENTVDAAETPISVSLCLADGQALTLSFSQAAQPESPSNGQYWLDTSGSLHTIKQWAEASGQWVSVPTVYVKLAANGIGKGFKQYDGIEISGLSGNEQLKKLNGSQILYGADESSIVIVGLIDQAAEVTSGTVKTARRVPDMDFITECGNRLWGCKYGMVDGKPVNEIYASKLGDCKNWRCFAGLATDSYAAARGSDGVFTGAVSYLGNPIFFKERCMERVYASGSGAHQIVTTECSGVQKGSARSLQVVGGVLYYLSGDGVQAFDGSLPVCISQALGAERYHGGVAGCWQEKYYLSALDREEKPSLLVYDSARQLWHREDALRAVDFAGKGTELYALGTDGRLWSLHGQSGQAEETFSWQVETGEMGMQSPERKRLTQLFLYLRPEKGQAVTAWVSYDQGETWIRQGQIVGSGGIREQAIAIRPRQCRRLRLRLAGSGQCTLYALTALYEKGSDGL